MADIIEMPKLSDTMTVGTLVKWLKKEGDAVKSGDMLAEVETDKATMELESFFDGTLVKIFSPEGSQIEVGGALCAIGKKGEKVEAPAKPAAPAVKPDPEPEAEAKTEPTKEASPTKDESPDDSAATAKPEIENQDSKIENPAPSPARLKISPLARKLATEKGLDPSTIKGSGPGGRIVRADILTASQQPKSASPRSPSSHGSTSTKGPIQEEKKVTVSNMRGVIAKRLLESKTTIPHFYLEVEVDAAPLLALRVQLNEALADDGVKLSVNDFILKASAEALRRVPAVNASWAGKTIDYHGAAHVSFAVAIEDGLITPVVRDAHDKSVFAISTEVKDLARAAKAKKLAPNQYTGGTFCVSNLGMMGIDRFSAIINPPNAAILAVGATVTKPVVRDGQIAIGQRMSLTLSCDHRVVDGALGAQFLAALRDLLEKPALLLL